MDSEKPVTLRKITENESSHWDAIVGSSPHGTVFHKWAWVRAVSKHSWMKLLGERIEPVFHPLIAEHDGRDIGLIPLYEFKGRILNYVYSPPLHSSVTYLGPCLNFPENLKRSSWERLHMGFHKAIDDYLKRIGAHAVCIQPPPGYDDMRPYLWLGYNVTPLYNYVTDLKHPVEEIFQRSESNFRNKVRRTEKEDYVVKEGSFSDVEALYGQQSRRYTEQDMHMNVTLEYLRELWQNMPEGSLRVFVVELDGKYVTASIEVSHKGRMLGWIGNPKHQSTAGSPNDLLNWEIIKHAVSMGCTEYENIWANEERLNQFKTKNNPGLSRYYSVARMNPVLSLAYEVKKFVKGGKIWGAGL